MILFHEEKEGSHEAMGGVWFAWEDIGELVNANRGIKVWYHLGCRGPEEGSIHYMTSCLPVSISCFPFSPLTCYCSLVYICPVSCPRPLLILLLFLLYLNFLKFHKVYRWYYTTSLSGRNNPGCYQVSHDGVILLRGCPYLHAIHVRILSTMQRHLIIAGHGRRYAIDWLVQFD